MVYSFNPTNQPHGLSKAFLPNTAYLSMEPSPQAWISQHVFLFHSVIIITVFVYSWDDNCSITDKKIKNAIDSTGSPGPWILADSKSADTVLGVFDVCITPRVLAVIGDNISVFLSAWYIMMPVGDNKLLSLWASDLNHSLNQFETLISLENNSSECYLHFLKLKHQLI